MDAITATWTRNPSDEAAVRNGCRFDVERGAYVVWWIERYCKLYEGEQAGQPLILRGCHDCGEYDQPEHRQWNDDAKAAGLERARRFAECVAAGHRIDWQYECTMRIFGWVKHSAKWKREVRRFRQVIVFIAKKGKKTPTLAAWSLYVTIGDGEPGQHVYIAAKDGKQSRITAEHVKHMIGQSPDLRKIMRINENTYRMSHAASRSFLEPLSSSNSRTQNSKEGLNGSVCIDEVHVVDRHFAGVLKGAGISRSEPLQIEVSTAGSDPESYGKDRFDLAIDVLAGKIEQENLFAAIYAAPQNLTDAQLADDPMKFARMANPALGHTVDPAEFMADYTASRNSLAELARFKMYRLNVWQYSESPWLDMTAWERCRRSYTDDSLLGMPCVAGLDLARTRDTCALPIIFWDDMQQVFRQRVWYWLPRARADALRDKVPYLEWAAQGHITLIDGDIIDFALVRRDICVLKERYEISRLMYDDCYAEQLVQALIEEDHVFMLDEVLSFAQTVRAFAGPTDDYEAQVLAGKLLHNGNPVLTWQAGNARVKTDANLNKRPVKQQFGDHRTIDGVVAGIMALSQMEEVKRIGVWSGNVLA